MSSKRQFGIKRAKYKRQIQAKMDAAEINQTQLAARAGVSRQAVSATLLGYIHSSSVLEELRKIGVSERFLCDPDKQQKTA